MGKTKPSKASRVDNGFDGRSRKFCSENFSVNVKNKTFIKPVKKIVSNPNLSPIELIREASIAENPSVNVKKKTFKKPVKKIVINPKLSPIELIREANIAERMALLEKLGFSVKKKVVKSKVKPVKTVKTASPVVLRKSYRIKK